MNTLLSTPWRLCKGALRFIFPLAIVTLVATQTVVAEDESPAVSQAEIDEIEADIARALSGPELSKVGGTLQCGDASCRGTYEDIINSIFLDHEGKTFLFVTPPVVPFLAASSHGCARDYYVVVQFNNESNSIKRDAAYEMLSQLRVARAMGYEIELRWTQSNYSSSWMVCKVDTVLVYGSPVSS